MGTVTSSVVLPTTSFELGVDIATLATAPTYFVLTTLVLTTVLPASFLWFNYTGTFIQVGPFAGNVAPTVRFRLNTVLLPGGSTVNMVAGRIMPVARQGRVAVTAGAQTMVVEISKFAGAANTLSINPVTRPDLEHAALTMLEQI